MSETESAFHLCFLFPSTSQGFIHEGGLSSCLGYSSVWLDTQYIYIYIFNWMSFYLIVLTQEHKLLLCPHVLNLLPVHVFVVHYVHMYIYDVHIYIMCIPCVILHVLICISFALCIRHLTNLRTYMMGGSTYHCKYEAPLKLYHWWYMKAMWICVKRCLDVV